ncbi:MAG: hypothetical protein JWN70_2547 [Planctomycetaceae bacterium]|nr:hypothetical protein [Planctomycetaceae bacterium]
MNHTIWRAVVERPNSGTDPNGMRKKFLLYSFALLVLLGSLFVVTPRVDRSSVIAELKPRGHLSPLNASVSSHLPDSSTVKQLPSGPVNIQLADVGNPPRNGMQTAKLREYVDHIQPNLKHINELDVKLTPKDLGRVDRLGPAEKIVPQHICFKSQFDAVRSPMTIKELFQLLGEPVSLGNKPGETVVWSCEDHRGISVVMAGSINSKGQYKCRIEEPEGLNFGFPRSNELQLFQYKGQGRVRFFVIPDRKPGEVEAAIKLVGAGHPAGAI